MFFHTLVLLLVLIHNDDANASPFPALPTEEQWHSLDVVPLDAMLL